jgi:two-component system, NtrC family, sensor kinase
VRIATRLWIVFVAEVILVLGLGMGARVRREKQLLLDVTLRDRRFFAHALHATLVRQHPGADPLAEAQAMLAEEEVADSHIEARIVTEHGGTDRSRAPVLTANDRKRLLHGGIVVEVVGEEILTYVPLDTVGRHALELREPHAIPGLLSRAGWRFLAGQATALATLAGIVTFALIGWLVGKPLGTLAEFARRVGSGDLSARVQITGRDETAILGHEMNQMVERLAAARKALEDADTERVTALERLRHADRLRTVGQLASSLAHELGTPLNVVSGHARIIEQDTNTSNDTRESAREMLEQSARMTRIIRDLLDFARRGPEIAEHNLGRLAERAARTLEPLARIHKIHIEVKPGEVVEARVDAQQILQVLTNLMMNAIQAMPDGGVVVVEVDAVEARAPEGVHAASGRYARFAVIDTGVGIAAEDVPQLFEAFFTRKDAGEGTGLGLAVVEGIVRDHRGWIEVSSEPAHGSRFEVLLPLMRV